MVYGLVSQARSSKHRMLGTQYQQLSLHLVGHPRLPFPAPPGGGSYSRPVEMAKSIKALSPKLGDLSSVPGIHEVGGVSRAVLGPPWLLCMCAHALNK